MKQPRRESDYDASASGLQRKRRRVLKNHSQCANHENDSSSLQQLAIQALSIVLGNLMIPNLGWNMSMLMKRLPSIKADILKNRERVLLLDPTTRNNSNDDEQQREQEPPLWSVDELRNSYLTEKHFIDEREVSKILHELEDFDVNSLLPSESIQHTQVSEL
jgi:hypothetical protein